MTFNIPRGLLNIYHGNTHTSIGKIHAPGCISSLVDSLIDLANGRRNFINATY